VRITCPSCQKKLAIPDEKIPPGAQFKATCPECNHLFTVFARSMPDQDDQPKATTAATMASIPEPDVFPPGTRTALLVMRDQAWIDPLTASLRDQNYQVAILDDPALSLAKLTINAYDLAVFEDSDEYRTLMGQIHSWPGTKRRKINVVLIGDEGKSLHPGLSFTRGVDCYLHQKDHARAHQLLQAAMEGFDAAYQAWHTAAKSLGKEN